MNWKELLKKSVLWILTAIFTFLALIFLLGGGVLPGILASAFVALVIPIDSWQAKIKKLIKGKLKPILAAILALFFFISVPSVDTTEPEVPSTTMSTEATTEIASEATTTATLESTAEATTEPTTEPTTEATTEPTTEATTEPTTEATTEPTTEPTTEATTEPTTEPTTEATTDPTTEPTTEATTEPTTEPTTEATTEATTMPTEDNGSDYVINTNSSSLRFHYPWCSSVDDMKDEHKWFYHGTREEIIGMGYTPCGRCKP